MDFANIIITNNFKINNNSSYLHVGAVLFVVIFIIIIKVLNKKNITDEQLILNIKRFIRKNLSGVTLKMLEIEFNLGYNEINNLSKNFKPAKYIKKERIPKSKRGILSKIDSSKKIKSTDITNPITKYKYSEILKYFI